MKMLVTALSLILGLSLLSTINCRPTVHECISLKQAENIVLYKVVRADTMGWDTELKICFNPPQGSHT